jgi:hypothetical protein
LHNAEYDIELTEKIYNIIDKAWYEWACK